MRRGRLPALLALLSPLLSTGCAVPASRPPHLPLPPGLLSCAAQPEPPALREDADLASWLLDLADAGEDCRSRLALVRGLEAARSAAP